MNKRKEVIELNNERLKGSNVKIDVFIPVIEKDIMVLPSVIDGIRSHVMHPIGKFYIISPESELIKEWCRKKKCTFIDENTVLPITKQEAGSGWIYQQLLKLNADKICLNKHILVADADTIFIAPHAFIRGKKTIFYCAKNYWDYPPIFDHFANLTGLQAVAPISLINHYMLFSKKRLMKLKRRIESIHGKPWYQAVLDTIDPTAYCPISEFEIYGNYMLAKHPSKVILAKGKNRERRSSDFYKLHTLNFNKLSKKFNSISFHNRG
ncbi:DUF6492 family protein [Ammoniphilus sp. CFH 90114]|uniref:DUF6492 family protein n=1 Tax=Ammoniphilus sp. CFH 90114 TaxID=2493665 RepID=UPI00100DD3DA|nr:DUF6492 family protein [Ammoniphilus sp. CFH 90114]RXT13983.1 hypothetical protein EIZ39_07565 [Ammoniphilus sp. CFH 90114]